MPFVFNGNKKEKCELIKKPIYDNHINIFVNQQNPYARCFRVKFSNLIKPKLVSENLAETVIISCRSTQSFFRRTAKKELTTPCLNKQAFYTRVFIQLEISFVQINKSQTH